MVRYGNNDWVGKLFGYLIGLVMSVLVLWLEFGGIWHAFKHYDVTDGLIAVFVPPYAWYRSVEFFFWLGRETLTEAEEDELEHFFKSLEYDNESVRILNESDGALMHPEAMEEALFFMRMSLSESQEVSDSVLAKLHPDLPKHYREELCEGMRLFIQGIEDIDNLTCLKGQMLEDKWADWYNRHLKELRKKVLKLSKKKG